MIDSQQLMYSSKLNLDLDYNAFNPKNPDLKNAMNLNIESSNGGYYITNEYSNQLCFEFPTNYELCGQIKLNNDEFLLFFNTPSSSEIGILKNCEYSIWVKDVCLNFSPDHWINGVYKFNNVCDSRTVYTEDGSNPDRNYNIDLPYPKIIKFYKDGIPVYSDKLDCDKTLATLPVKFPCIKMEPTSGNLINGKYQIALAYSNSKNVITEYFVTDSLVLNNKQNGLEVILSNLDTSYSYYEIVLISQTENGQTSTIIGTYPIGNNIVSVSKQTNNVRTLEEVFTAKTHYITSSHIVVVNNQLLKAGLIEKNPINYQSQANKILSNWVTMRVKKEDAYLYPQYMRDEAYSLNIKWIYINGTKTLDFHIPNNTPNRSDSVVSGKDAFETKIDCLDIEKKKQWEVYNTASLKSNYPFVCGSCSSIVARGDFGQWDSSTNYPDYIYTYKGNIKKVFDKLANTPIRLHKFPDNCITNHFFICEDGSEYVDILGIEFSNITHPVDLDGNKITDIIGYQISRADRVGNESILSKGLISNMLLDDDSVLFPNFPYNDLTPNRFISSKSPYSNLKGDEKDYKPFTKYSKKDYTYISPETSYTLPLKGTELKLYNEQLATVTSKISETYKHPKHQILTNFDYFLSSIVGFGVGLLEYGGKSTYTNYTESKKKYTGSIGTNGLFAGGGATGANVRITSVRKTGLSFEITTTSRCQTVGTITKIGGDVCLIPFSGIGPTIKMTFLAPLVRDGISNNIIGTATVTDTGCIEGADGYTVAPMDAATGVSFDTSVSSLIGKKPISIPGTGLVTSIFYALQGIATTIKAVKALSPFTQYAHQIDSIANYDRFECTIKKGNVRRFINSSDLLIPTKQTLNSHKINNLNRESMMYISVNDEFDIPKNVDNSRDISCLDINIKQAVNYYGAIKRSVKNQYGNIDSNTLIPISCWIYPTGTNGIYSTPSLFNGDTYITKFTFKTHMPLFNPVVLNEANGFEVNYEKLSYIGKTRFWLNGFDKNVVDLYEVGLKKLTRSQANLDCGEKFDVSDLISLNLKDLFLKSGNFYTSVNGVYSFFVESSYINDFRVKSDNSDEIHYPYQDYTEINRSDRQYLDNKFLYNQTYRLRDLVQDSLVQTRFEPELCNKNDFLIVYSEISTNEDNTDNWRIFRPLSRTQLSKKDGALTTLHTTDEHNLLISFEDGTYVTQGEESLITQQGTPILIGQGDIFSRRLQKLSFDKTGYTGSQDKYSFITTRHGTFWVDRKRKRIFLYSNGITEVSQEGITQWLQKFLVNKTNINHNESIKAIYDNHFDKIYFTEPNGECSWTLSYRVGHGWQSFHSFIPIEYFALSNNFYSCEGKGIWLHNNPSQSYQTYYGIPQPYYFSWIVNPGINTILQSVESRTEITDEVNFNNQVYNNDIFYNKFNIFSSYSNSGELSLTVKNNKDRSSNFTNYNGKAVVSFLTNNKWRINNFRNFAVNQPHSELSCNGVDYNYLNINPQLAPNQTGNIQGDWFCCTLKNDQYFNKKFKTIINIQENAQVYN